VPPGGLPDDLEPGTDDDRLEPVGGYGPAPAPDAVHRLEVSPDDAGGRLDRFLAARLPGFSRSRLAQLADEGHVTVDGAVAKPALRLKPTQRVEVRVPAPRPATPLPEDLPVPVLYEDADLVVVDKPAGMVVHPAAGVYSGTLVNALLHQVRDLAGIGGELRPGIVHRLDRETSGALVVAKTEQALAALQRSFQAREVEKEYLAVAHGMPPPRGTFDTPFGRHPVDRVKMTGRLPPGTLRRAVTHWGVEEAFGGAAARVAVRLETGRTHQIRVHFSEAGFPLVADTTYGGDKRDRRAEPWLRAASARLGRHALHAHRLSFPHPRTGAPVRCEAPIPPDLAALLAAARAACG
jgi:23S rRNA pseudouridine1911/1915/1917 synthase